MRHIRALKKYSRGSQTGLLTSYLPHEWGSVFDSWYVSTCSLWMPSLKYVSTKQYADPKDTSQKILEYSYIKSNQSKPLLFAMLVVANSRRTRSKVRLCLQFTLIKTRCISSNAISGRIFSHILQFHHVN